MKNWEDYTYENGVLKNKFDIEDISELYKKEEAIVAEKLALLILYPISRRFDTNHLKAIHRFLFSDLYQFAGEFREVDIYKEETKFLNYELIEEELDKLLNYVKLVPINSNNSFDISRFLGDFYHKLIMIHPFREGNGRTIREFLREFVKYKFPDYELDYSKVNKDNFLLGITEHDRYPLLLAYEINNALTKVDIKNK